MKRSELLDRLAALEDSTWERMLDSPNCDHTRLPAAVGEWLEGLTDTDIDLILRLEVRQILNPSLAPREDRKRATEILATLTKIKTHGGDTHGA